MGVRGDADVARVAVLFGEPSRARMLMALGDGRALPASVLAAEAGLSAPATSAHLAQLRAAGLVAVEPSGRHRYYRLAGPEVAAVLEAMAQIAPPKPVTSLREGTRANALRTARTCYDHLAGQLGVQVTAGLLRQGALESTDGIAATDRRDGDRLSAPLPEHPYRLGPAAADVFGVLGIDLAQFDRPSRRPLLRFCMDWTEQRHHVAGRLGAAVCTAAVELGWIVRKPHQRAVRITEVGLEAFPEWLCLPAGSVGKRAPQEKEADRC
jgi:DNA-binding transcriptional ArsR family regulator